MRRLTWVGWFLSYKQLIGLCFSVKFPHQQIVSNCGVWRCGFSFAEEFFGLYKTFMIKVFGRIVNSFSTNVPLLHLLKTSENLQEVQKWKIHWKLANRFSWLWSLNMFFKNPVIVVWESAKDAFVMGIRFSSIT